MTPFRCYLQGACDFRKQAGEARIGSYVSQTDRGGKRSEDSEDSVSCEQQP